MPRPRVVATQDGLPPGRGVGSIARRLRHGPSPRRRCRGGARNPGGDCDAPRALLFDVAASGLGGLAVSRGDRVIAATGHLEALAALDDG